MTHQELLRQCEYNQIFSNHLQTIFYRGRLNRNAMENLLFRTIFPLDYAFQYSPTLYQNFVQNDCQNLYNRDPCSHTNSDTEKIRSHFDNVWLQFEPLFNMIFVMVWMSFFSGGWKKALSRIRKLISILLIFTQLN